MVYRRNPFAPSREARVLLLAGIKGYGTRAAAEAVALPAVTKHLEQLLADGQIGPADVASQTLEAVARVRIAGGTLLRDTLQVEAVRVGPADWAAETYSLVKSNRLDLEVGPDEDWVGSIRVNGMEMSGRLSLDSREIVLLLARRRREDYLGGAAREGYMTAQELAKAGYADESGTPKVRISRINKDVEEAANCRLIESGARGESRYRLAMDPRFLVIRES
jgi:hypothetical protein